MATSTPPVRRPQARPAREGRKPRKPPEPVTGSFVWATPFDGNTGRLVISTPTGAAAYTVTAVRIGNGPHFGGHIAGYELVNEGNGESYCVSLEAWGMDCTCWDFLIRQRDATSLACRACKHIVGLQTALERLPQAG